jgi:hypothetical protein
MWSSGVGVPDLSACPQGPIRAEESNLDRASRLLREGVERFNRERFPDGTLRNPPKSVAPSKSTQALEDLIVRAAEIADEEQEELEARIQALRSTPFGQRACWRLLTFLSKAPPRERPVVSGARGLRLPGESQGRIRRAAQTVVPQMTDLGADQTLSCTTGSVLIA